MGRPNAIELFSGCGGMSTGLLDAGYDVRLGVDHDRPSVDVFEYNHAYRGSHSLLADVAKLSSHDLLSRAGIQSVDLLVGGPPLSGGARGSRFPPNQRMLLYPTCFALPTLPAATLSAICPTSMRLRQRQFLIMFARRTRHG
jgi:hypothetical protein